MKPFYGVPIAAAALLTAIALPAQAQRRPKTDTAKPVKPARFAPVTVQVTTDKKSYTPAEPIAMTLTVKNNTAKSIDLQFASGKTFDFEILSGKRSLWQSSMGLAFTQAEMRLPLEAGKTRTMTAAYKPGTENAPVLSAGTYTLTGTLTAAPPLSSSLTFTIAGAKGDMTSEDALKQILGLDVRFAPMQKTFDEADAALKKSPDDMALKTAYVKAAYNYGHALTNERGDVPPRIQYRATLALFRRALAIDPAYQPAITERDTIEGIYRQMNRPVPQ